MVKVSKNGTGVTLYIELNIYPNSQDPRKNLTISCPDKDTQFKTTLSDNGLQEFRKAILGFYEDYVLSKQG